MEKTQDELIRLTASKLFKPKSPNYIGFKTQVESLTDDLLATMFPYHLSRSETSSGESWIQCLLEETRKAFSYVDASGFAPTFISRLPEIEEMLQTDILAAYQGDPAAQSLDEIILTYPAFMAISTYRLAHLLYTEKIPLIPRMMTEYAHRETGIDIHPGATIGSHFFIDHGTGVVIGETTTIGHHVKLYQHVTIGAKSFDVAPDGSLTKGIKRHPDIGNNVVIYAGATILGGTTIIGDGATIGGNVWLTHSISPGCTVLAEPPVLREKGCCKS